MKSNINFINNLSSYRDEEIKVLQSLDLVSISTVMNVLENARLANKKIFVCGNGGSAATASHYVCDFNKGVNSVLLESSRKSLISEICPYNFEALNDNVPTMMAVANDMSYEEVFRYALSIKMRQGDVLIGISGSGNSINVLNAFDYCKQNGGTTIAIVGYNGGMMKKLADHCIHVNINNMQISEDIHMLIDHMMMWVLSNELKK